MTHLNVLSPEEKAAVDKFKEYGATVIVSYGNKATWSDMVHTNAYSDEALKNKLVALRTKVSQQEALEDEDQVEDASTTELTAPSPLGTVKFSSNEILLVVRSARKVRKNFETILKQLVAKENLEKEIKRLEKKTTTPKEQLENARKALADLEGKEYVAPQVEVSETTPTA